MKTTTKGLRDIAEKRVAQYLRNLDPNEITSHHSEDLVAIVIDTLKDPDRFMLDAGRKEVALAIAASPGPSYERNLAGAIFRTMIHEAG